MRLPRRLEWVDGAGLGWALLIEDTCEPIVTTMSSVVGAANEPVGTAGARVGVWEWVLPFRREVVPWQKRGFLLAYKECFLVFWPVVGRNGRQGHHHDSVCASTVPG